MLELNVHNREPYEEQQLVLNNFIKKTWTVNARRLINIANKNTTIIIG